MSDDPTQAILAILRAGGEARWPYKRRYDDPIGTASAGRLEPLPRRPGVCYYLTHPSSGITTFDTPEAAARALIRAVFVPGNLGLCCAGIRMRDLAQGRALDDLSAWKLRQLVRRYRREYFALDHPFVKTGR